MRRIPILLAWLALPALGFGQAGVPVVYDGNAPAEAQVPKLYAAWKAERDPARRASIGKEVVDAIIHEIELPQNDIADEVARDGRPIRTITTPAAEKIALTPLAPLKGVHTSDEAWPASPVFRRVAGDRLEAWTSTEGWLFDGKGRLLTHVKVPRRDGTGREWFGAFLPDGTWITTDLWEQDEQINAFNAHGQWLWEVKGADILKQLPPNADTGDGSSPKPLICWARADRIGQGWIVCVGEDWNTACALVAESKTIALVPDGENAWDLVYPRAMGTRGFITALGINSDDGKLRLTRGEPMHGPAVGWPEYSVTPGSWSRVIRAGDNRFGFWPRSHALFIEAEGDDLFAPHRVWFFDDAGRYAGEIGGSYLGDASNKYGLLVTVPGDGVATLMPGLKGPTVTQVRAFTWPDGSHAVPIALYDDLQLGFFLRGPEIEDSNPETARRARADAELVLAHWRS